MKTKRLLSIALAVVMLLAFAPASAVAEPSDACPDCDARDWVQTADGSNCTYPGQIE